ncbi:MAG TPA: tetratricopeptide repeat protein [Terriglobales bacterium]
MAFGFGFNKQKVLSAAEKCVQQGKLQNAIAEYEKILKHDSKDLTVMNTVGDLHARLGENDKAADCFKSVGDAYASQGFTVKAIAMYKKLSKLKSSTECVLRLAELYTQQGLFNDARAQYLQVAEDFLKSGQLDQAVRIFEKTLEMDPENVPMRTRLAEVYVRLGKKPEAWQILTAAAESLRAKGQLAAADEILQRMLKLEPGNSYAMVLRGRAALDSGDPQAAIESLSKVADLDTNPEGLRALFQAYLKTKDFAEAGPLAAKLANVHDDGAAVTDYTDALLEAQQYREALQVYEQNADRLLRNEPGKLVEALRPIVSHVQDDPQALEAVLALYQKAGETAHLTEIYELLAHAYVQSGDLDKAREYYLKLMQLEPANPMHARNYQQVIEKQGAADAPHLITAEEGAVLVDELEAAASFIDQRYDDDVALAVRAALTDAELFISYNMPGKALEPLIAALPKAPRDLRINQKLAALHTRASRFAEAAVCCRTLESVYHDAGHAEEAARYGDLAAKYEERSASGSEAVAAPEPPEVAPAGPAAQEFEIAAPAEAAGADADEPKPAEEAPPLPAPVLQGGPSGLFFHAAATPAAVEAAPAAQQASEFSLAPSPEHATEDLSTDWEHDLTVDAPQPEAPAHAEAEPAVAATAPELAVEAPAEPAAADAGTGMAEAMEEVRFYLGQGLIDQAEGVLAKLEAFSPDSPELAVLRLGVDSAKQSLSGTPAEEITIEEPQAEAAAEQPIHEPVVEPEVVEAVAKQAVEPVAAAEAVVAPEPVIEAEPVHAAAVEPEPEHAVVAASTAAPQPWPQAPVHEPKRQPEAPRPVLEDLVSDIEASLGDEFLGQKQEAPAPIAPEPEVASSGAPAFRSGTLDDFVSDLEASLGNDFYGETPAAQAPARAEAPVARAEAPVARAAAASAAPMASAVPGIPTSTAVPARVPQPPPAISGAATAALDGASVDLADMFGELKQELEGGSASADEDPETHYNLGVAFREMGLLDEAIGEFQKVCQAADHGRAFSQMMQTYTWLAQCFLDKGVPQAAIRWYEKALTLPSLDAETRTALHYELGSSFESAGNKAAALNNFLEVYGSNIDYRDVGERIKALRP